MNQSEEDNGQEILIEPEKTLPDFTFDNLPPQMRESIKALGWTAPMPVQSKATPYLMDNRDMIVQSRTGSGKTGAFIIPLILRIDPRKSYPQAIILVPTRELAGQVYREFEILSQGMNVRGALVYGGVGYGAQLEALNGGAQVIIGTPGRILDLIGRRALVLDRVGILVFDEADEMLSMGFYPDMREIRRYLPNDRSSWMFSATMPYRVQMLAREFLHEPEFLSLSEGNVSVSAAEHRYYDVPPLEKDLMLMRLIEMENPDSAIVFCNTKQDVEYLSTVLKNYGYNVDQLSGDLDQKSRESAMARIRAGQTRFLVATDVAARGIDISDLSHVVQYDVPKDPESYIHRAGRTARAGNTGVVITLVANMSERSDLKKIERRYNVDFVELPMPTKDDLENRLSERLIVALDDRFRSQTNRMQRERMKRFVSVARELVASDDEVMLLAMLLDEVYYKAYHVNKAAVPQVEEKKAAPVAAPRKSEQGRTRDDDRRRDDKAGRDDDRRRDDKASRDDDRRRDDKPSPDDDRRRDDKAGRNDKRSRDDDRRRDDKPSPDDNRGEQDRSARPIPGNEASTVSTDAREPVEGERKKKKRRRRRKRRDGGQGQDGMQQQTQAIPETFEQSGSDTNQQGEFEWTETDVEVIEPVTPVDPQRSRGGGGRSGDKIAPHAEKEKEKAVPAVTTTDDRKQSARGRAKSADVGTKPAAPTAPTGDEDAPTKSTRAPRKGGRRKSEESTEPKSVDTTTPARTPKSPKKSAPAADTTEPKSERTPRKGRGVTETTVAKAEKPDTSKRDAKTPPKGKAEAKKVEAKKADAKKPDTTVAKKDTSRSKASDRGRDSERDARKGSGTKTPYTDDVFGAFDMIEVYDPEEPT